MIISVIFSVEWDFVRPAISKVLRNAALSDRQQPSLLLLDPSYPDMKTTKGNYALASFLVLE